MPDFTCLQIEIICFSIGLQAGYGVTISNNQIKPAPYIGVGLSYSLINF